MTRRIEIPDDMPLGRALAEIRFYCRRWGKRVVDSDMTGKSRYVVVEKKPQIKAKPKPRLFK